MIMDDGQVRLKEKQKLRNTYDNRGQEYKGLRHHVVEEVYYSQYQKTHENL